MLIVLNNFFVYTQWFVPMGRNIGKYFERNLVNAIHLEYQIYLRKGINFIPNSKLFFWKVRKKLQTFFNHCWNFGKSFEFCSKPSTKYPNLPKIVWSSERVRLFSKNFSKIVWMFCPLGSFVIRQRKLKVSWSVQGNCVYCIVFPFAV